MAFASETTFLDSWCSSFIFESLPITMSGPFAIHWIAHE